MRKLFLTIMVSITLATTAFTVTTSEAIAKTEKPIVLKLSTFGPAMGQTERVFQKWADKIKEQSKGRVKIDCFYGGSLSKASDTRSALELGVIDIGFVPTSETPGQTPASLLLETPLMGYTGGRMATHVWNELLASHSAFKNDFKTVKVLISWMSNARFIHTTKRVIRMPEDMKGARVLAWGTTANAVKLIGGVPVQVPPPAMYQALDRGMVEGIVTSPFFIKLFKIDPTLKTHTYGVDLGYAGFALLMNRDSWSKLPDDVKEFMSNELNLWATEEMIKIDETSQIGIQKSWEKMNHTIVNSTKEEMEAWRLAMQPLHKALIEKYEAKGVPAGEIFERSKQIITNFSK